MHPQEDRNRLRVEEVALRQGLRWIPPRSLPSKHLATEGANRSGLARGPLSARRVPSPRLEVAAKEAKEATARRTWASHRKCGQRVVSYVGDGCFSQTAGLGGRGRRNKFAVGKLRDTAIPLALKRSAMSEVAEGKRGDRTF